MADETAGTTRHGPPFDARDAHEDRQGSERRSTGRVFDSAPDGNRDGVTCCDMSHAFERERPAPDPPTPRDLDCQREHAFFAAPAPEPSPTEHTTMKLLLLSAATALLAPSALAQGGDDCANATAISGYGLYSWDNTNATTTGPADCNGRPARKDLWWAWTAPATEGVRFETCGTNTSVGTRIVAYDGADCGSLVVADCAAQSCFGGLSTVNFLAVAGQTYLLRVGSRQANTSGAGEFRLSNDPCLTAVDDALEENDDCASSVAIADGSYNNLFCSKSDPDWYEFCVAAGATLNIDVFFSNSTGDIDIFLGDDCGAAGNLAIGGTGSDDENVNWLNAGTTDVTVWLRIELWSGDVSNDCNNYSMTVTGAMGSCSGGGGGLGSNYCSTNPNSSGLSARMTASGSAAVADNDVTLSGIQLPASVPALFITSSTQGFVTNPSGSIGNLCLGGAIGRYIGPGQIQFSDAMGVVSLPIDLTMVPQSSGFVSVMVGDSRNFQVWYRDLVGGAPVSNFTDGLEITFQ